MYATNRKCLLICIWLKQYSRYTYINVSVTKTGKSHASNISYYSPMLRTLLNKTFCDWVIWHKYLYRFVLHLISIKSERWIISHCLGLSHDKMVCSVCIAMFLWVTVIYYSRRRCVMNIKPKYDNFNFVKCAPWLVLFVKLCISLLRLVLTMASGVFLEEK